MISRYPSVVQRIMYGDVWYIWCRHCMMMYDMYDMYRYVYMMYDDVQVQVQLLLVVYQRFPAPHLRSQLGGTAPTSETCPCPCRRECCHDVSPSFTSKKREANAKHSQSMKLRNQNPKFVLGEVVSAYLGGIFITTSWHHNITTSLGPGVDKPMIPTAPMKTQGDMP